MWKAGLTEDDDVQDEDYEPDDPPARPVLPGIVAAGGDDSVGDRCSGDQGGQPELEESRKSGNLHHVDCTLLIVLDVNGAVINSEEIDNLC